MKIADMTVGEITSVMAAQSELYDERGDKFAKFLDDLVFHAWWIVPLMRPVEVTYHYDEKKDPDPLLARIWAKVRGMSREVPEEPVWRFMAVLLNESDERQGGKEHMYIRQHDILVWPVGECGDGKGWVVYPQRADATGVYVTRSLSTFLDMPPGWGPLTK